MSEKQEKQYTYEEFLAIIATLRSENGCPWDKVQTHDSLKSCMMEEAAELLASIRIYNKTGNPENMIEELGDVLLQVVMHAQIASEEGLFTMEDVINEVSRKMVRRHPHVFGTESADTPDEVLVNWEEIKKEEKKDKDWVQSPLKDIPKELPSLTRAVKVLKKIDKHYEKGNTFDQDTAAICELAEALRNCEPQADNKETEALLSELLLRISDVARITKIPQEQALADRIEDLIEKYE
ncbi:MAG: MazG family protein [Lachnospiraceae bacterium]|jgi:tetrapyrrole methylase family protein/MazG family protein|nr:MazG family protein [Lachnospiraceae bacterium]